MKKFGFAGWAVLISVVVVVAGLWLLLQQFKQIDEAARLEPFTLIPSDAWLVLDLRQTSEIKSFLGNDSLFWSELADIDEVKWIRKTLGEIDSVFLADTRVAKAFEGSRVLVSLHLATKGQSPALVQFRHGQGVKTGQFQQFLTRQLKEKHGYLENQFMGVSIYRFSTAQSEKHYWLAFFMGSVLIGQSQRLIEHAITQHHAGSSLATSQGLSKVRYGKDRITNMIYLDGAKLCEVYKLLTTQKAPALFPCQAFSDWMAWDFDFPDQELRLTGLALTADPRTDFTGLLSEQPPSEPFLLHFVPSASAAFAMLNLNPTHDFDEALNAFLKTDQTHFSDSSFAQKELRAHLGSAIAEILLYNPRQKPQESVVVLVHITDSPGLFEKMKSSQSNDPEGSLLNAVDTVFEKIIWHFSAENWLTQATKGLIPYPMSYFAFIDSVLVAAKNPQIVSRVLLHHHYGQVIAFEPGLEDDFIFQQPASNLFYMLNMPYLMAMIQGNLTQPVLQIYSQPNQGVNLPDRLTAQFVAHLPGLMFSNITIHRQGSKLAAFHKPMWQVSLDTAAAIAPVSVFNHNERTREIIVQDKNNNLYLIDRFGKMLWKKQIGYAIISPIYQVDRLRNGRYQYLFSTLSHLHLVDRNGNPVKGYPVRLPSPAQQGITLTDYEGNKNYRIFFAGENRRIYNLLIDGALVSGWQTPRLENPASRPLQHFRLGNRDYLVVTDTEGKPYFFDRRGRTIFEIDPKIRLSGKNPLFAFDSKSESFFIALGQQGEILEIIPQGAVHSFKPDTATTSQGLVFIQDPNLLQNIYVLIGNRTISAFDRFGKELFSKAMPGPLILTATEIRVANKHFAGLLTHSPDLVYLIDTQGQLLAPFPLGADQMFILESLHQDQAWAAICAEDNFIRAFLISGF